VSLRLYWVRNDGMSGHVFLTGRELFELSREMEAQAMAGWLDLSTLAPGARIPPGQIDLTLTKASPEPQVLEDAKLWSDWLAFLSGARDNGGLVVQ
jgi:hypothetical protein